jgi:hypothetical protein
MSGKIKSAEEMELDREEQQLRDEAASIDPVRPEDAEYNDDANPAKARAVANESHPSANGERPDGAKKSDVTDTAKSEPSKTNQNAEPKPGEQQPKADQKTTTPEATPYQKERARLNESWKKLEADKEAIRAERDAIATERRALAEQHRMPPQPETKPAIDGADAGTWEQIAADFEAEGNLKLAQRARANVAKLREQEAAAAPAHRSSEPRERFTAEERQAMVTEWKGHLQKLQEEIPELKETESPLRKRVSFLIQTMPIYSMRGDGIRLAVQHAQAELKTGQAESQMKELQSKLAALQQKNTRLESLTALPSGSASPQSGSRKFDDLNIDEQEAALRAEAEAA